MSLGISIRDAGPPPSLSCPRPLFSGFLDTPFASLKLAAHVLASVVWVSLVTAGAVGEVRQTSHPDMTLVCGVDRGRGDLALFPYSSECSATRAYNVAFNVLHVTGATLALVHMSLFLAEAAYAAAFSLTGSISLVRPHLLEMVWVASSVASSFAYQHVLYYALICGHGGLFCAHLPSYHWVLVRVFRSFLVCGSLLSVLKCGFIAGFYALFLVFHSRTWRDLLALENCLLLDGRLEETFEVEGRRPSAGRMVQRVYDIQDFVPRWTKKDADDILDSLPTKAATVMGALLGRDASEGEELSRAGFLDFARKKGMRGDPGLLWEVLTHDGRHGAICRDSLEDALYDLFFYRKGLACAVSTDTRLLFYAYLYLVIALVPGAAIVVSKIFEYDDAFASGIDLFKTYAVILSYGFSCISSNLQFLWIMATQRPFNIGDILQHGDDVYEVISFDAAHTSLVGGAACILSNRSVLDGGVLNLTKACPADSLELHIPLNSGFDVRSMGTAMDDYMRLHPRDVRPGSVRCGWVGVAADHKAIRWNWRYRFTITGRSRLKAARTRLANFLISRCNADIVHSVFVLNVAAGGGMNENPDIQRHAAKEWKTE